MRVWVVCPFGSRIPLEVLCDESTKNVKKRIGNLEQCREASAAWTIEGWFAPRVYHEGREMHDDQSLAEAGVRADSVLEPSYDSASYNLMDPAFYGGFPDAKMKSPCAIGRELGSEWDRGPGHQLQESWENVAGKVKNVCLGAGIGAKVRRDEGSLAFVVESVEAGGAAESAGIRRGDRITEAGGRRCVDTSGLGKSEVDRIRFLEDKSEIQTGSWGDWWGGRSGHAIVSVEELRQVVGGLPVTAVTVRYVQGGDRQGPEKEAVMWRTPLSSACPDMI